MRKHQQRQILELLKTIGEAQAAGLYADCQDGAISVGDYIEQSEREGTQTVTLLEEYCELLFKASNGDIGEKQLRRHMIKIENSVKTELKPNRIEVVFLPYQLSMWDSLESIYLAAKEDPDCDVYVVPIPYIEKNANGSQGTMHYDGDQYPESIGAVDWQSYDMETRHPDVVFTHYAYDDMTVNASVHPNFYSKRLKQYCEMLVHVPYFVTAGDTVEEYYGYLPGILYADRVITQSEAVRQSYIEHYTKYDKEMGWKGQFGKAEEKFVALGSPKFDKVINSKREDYELPEAWERLLTKPDGTKKKAVLYNTHMFTWIKGGEQYFKKIRSVFDTFRNRDDVVLWWRPHPNTELNFRTQRPHLLREYASVVSDYLEGGWGIYDDTPDLHRAIACTDAYYGDWSSLVPMYGVTGRSVVIQDAEITDGTTVVRIAEVAVDNDGNWWGFDLFRDGLFELNSKHDTARYVVRSGVIPTYLSKKYMNSTHRYLGISCINDEVICFPYFTDNILVHNQNDETAEIIPLDREYLLSPESDGYGLSYTIEYQGKVYCFGVYSKAIIVFNAKDHSVRYDTMLYDNIGLLTETKQYAKYPLYMSECSADGEITLLMRDCQHLLRYTLPTQKIEIIASNLALSKCNQADFDGQDYWLISDKNDKLVKWVPVSNAVIEYNMLLGGYSFSGEDGVFTGIADCGDYILVFPGFGNAFLKFDKETGIFSEFKDMPMPEDSGVYKYDKPKHAEDKLFAFARFNHTMYVLDRYPSIISQHKFVIDIDSQDRFASDYLDAVATDSECADSFGYVIGEQFSGDITKVLSLSGLHRRSVNTKYMDTIKRLTANPEGDSGIAIYDLVRNLSRS
ncbi:MAG: hypothetical protein FWH57_09765 [Oscillospiraceae bacterium]|nr:hypothetical protein [Oscillospiraceae bacterium]